MASESEAVAVQASGPGDRVFLAAIGLAFVAGAAGTVYWCGSMSGGMAMPGGWTMSMAWMRMPGQSRAGAAATFLAMWTVMMVGMMLPSLAPMLLRYRRSVRTAREARLGGLTAIAGAGYFFVWASLGAAVYPLGVALAEAEMRWPALARAVPVATGALLLLAGALQLTRWKVERLRRCQATPGCARARDAAPDAWSAWRQGLRMGVDCGACCLPFTLALLLVGVMDVAAMGLVAAGITLERVGSRPASAARAAGVVVVAAGAVMLVRAWVAG